MSRRRQSVNIIPVSGTPGQQEARHPAYDHPDNSAPSLNYHPHHRRISSAAGGSGGGGGGNSRHVSIDMVRGLLNRQALGLLNQHPAGPPAKLSAKAMEQFKLSAATEDRKKVLALESKMFAEKKKWAQMESSKATKLSHALTDDPPKPKPAAPKKKAFLQPAVEKKPEESEEDEMVVLPRRRLSNLATKESWGDLKALAHAAKKGGKKFAAAVPRGASKGWGTILNNMHVRQQEAIAGKGSALAGFSWGDDQPAAESAEEEKPKELSNLSEGFVRIPAGVDMPDQLADFIAGGKKAQPAQQQEQPAGNPYSMDLN